MAPNSDSEPHKRKRNDDDAGQGAHSDRIPQPPPPQLGNAAQISYISRANATPLQLIHGDGDTFSDVLTLISEYEGVLTRHESLASNLGAKLTGPRILKAMEGVFEGTITTSPPQTAFTPDPVTWLDIVEFAKASPSEFVLTPSPAGHRTCHFHLKGVSVEISEDDWRLIMTGALDRLRLVPTQPLEEDENVEFVTLEILEQRLQMLTRKADEVARRARQLNYQLSGRKAAIKSRRSPQTSATGFQAVNHIARPATAPAPGYDLNADLLQQYLAMAHNQSNNPNQLNNHRVSSVGSIPPTPMPLATPSTTPRISAPQPPPMSSSRPSPGYHSEPITRDVDEEHRALVTARIDKLGRGGPHQSALRSMPTPKDAMPQEPDSLPGLHQKACEIIDESDESRGDSAPTFSNHSQAHETSTEHGEEAAGLKYANRIAIGRHVDDIWRKGPRDPRLLSMDLDIDPQDTATPMPTVETSHAAGSSKHVMLSHMASAASAAADAAAASRGAPHGS
ncbi:C6 finger domain-containing protein [Apiospora phragmitis]|uniref:C6 finger domain-containing protein n=1 Tax=Apiospora phragmitis TaxID=2905665 RepID=A0ABR1VTX2_9PEZI